MKKIFFFLFPVFCLFALPGIEYRHLSGDPSIHILEVDPSLYEIKPVKALDNGIGRESVLSIASRYDAVASINGGFFSIGDTLDGRACGALKIFDWYALPFKPRGCIGWSHGDQTPRWDRLLASLEGNYDLQPIAIDGLNRARKVGEAVLFTPCFHRTTLTPPDGEEIVIVDGVVQAIVKGGSTKIPDRGTVLSVQEKSPLYHSFTVGKPLTFTLQPTPLLEADRAWNELDYIVGGTPLLIYQGVRVTDFEAEQTILTFLSLRHARTAIGVLPNGHWVFVVVDQTDGSSGMTMNELADFMERLGCTYALNLDGGGSSTMVYENSVKNVPRGDQDEAKGQHVARRVSDAIIIRNNRID